VAKKKPAEAPKPLAEWDFRVSLSDRVGKLHGTAHGAVRRDARGLHLGKGGHVRTSALSKYLRAKTLEVWVELAARKQRGGGVISVQTLDGNVSDAIVFGEQQPRRWMAGSDFFRRTKPLGGPVETHKKVVHVALVYGTDGTITAYRNGLPYGKSYRST